MVFERDATINPRLLQGIKTWTETAIGAKWIDEKGFLLKDGLKILRRIRFVGSVDKWDMYDEYHLGMHTKRVWKYLKLARERFSPFPKDLTNEEVVYLNSVVLLENLGVLRK